MYLYLFSILYVISNVCGEEHASGRSRKPHGENRIHRSFLFSSQRCNHIWTTMQTFFYSKNIIPIRSNKSKTFLICNQGLRVPTEICDSNNISVCIKSRVDNLFKFSCLCLCLCMIILRAELITSSSSCALPQHLSFFCSSHYYCFFLCQTFTNASLLPNLAFLLTSCVCHIQSIHSLHRAVLKETCRRWKGNGKGKARIEPTESVGVTCGFRQMSLCGVNAILSESQKGSTPACEISQRKD